MTAAFVDPFSNKLRADPSSTAYDGRGCACDDEHRGGDFCSRCGAATRAHLVSTAIDQHGYAPQFVEVYTRPRNRHERRAAAARARTERRKPPRRRSGSLSPTRSTGIPNPLRGDGASEEAPGEGEA